MTSQKTTAKDIGPVFNRVLYGGFVFFSAYFLLVNNDVLTAASNLGIALIFDPFNPATKWTDRKSWQKAWLLIHVAVTLCMFAFGLLINR
jgi:hypothetical protein